MMRTHRLSRTSSRRRSSSRGEPITCASRGCRPSLARVPPDDRTTPGELLPRELERRCGRRVGRAPEKTVRAVTVRHQSRQAGSESRTCVACLDRRHDLSIVRLRLTGSVILLLWRILLLIRIVVRLLLRILLWGVVLLRRRILLLIGIAVGIGDPSTILIVRALGAGLRRRGRSVIVTGIVGVAGSVRVP